MEAPSQELPCIALVNPYVYCDMAALPDCLCAVPAAEAAGAEWQELVRPGRADLCCHLSASHITAQLWVRSWARHGSGSGRPSLTSSSPSSTQEQFLQAKKNAQIKFDCFMTGDLLYLINSGSKLWDFHNRNICYSPGSNKSFDKMYIWNPMWFSQPSDRCLIFEILAPGTRVTSKYLLKQQELRTQSINQT